MLSFLQFLMLSLLCAFSSISFATDIEAEVLNTVKSYNADFSGGNNSLYNQRYSDNPIIPREESIIINSFNNTLVKVKKKQRTNITILDFGCGDGRLLSLFQDIAKKKSGLTN